MHSGLDVPQKRPLNPRSQLEPQEPRIRRRVGRILREVKAECGDSNASSDEDGGESTPSSLCLGEIKSYYVYLRCCGGRGRGRGRGGNWLASNKIVKVVGSYSAFILGHMVPWQSVRVSTIMNKADKGKLSIKVFRFNAIILTEFNSPGSLNGTSSL